MWIGIHDGVWGVSVAFVASEFVCVCVCVCLVSYWKATYSASCCQIWSVGNLVLLRLVNWVVLLVE